MSVHEEEYGYNEEFLYYELREYLQCHKMSDLLHIISDVITAEIEDAMEASLNKPEEV